MRLKKLPQYAIENEKIRGIGEGKISSNYIYVDYLRLNKTFFYAHLDCICVKKGQEIYNKNKKVIENNPNLIKSRQKLEIK